MKQLLLVFLLGLTSALFAQKFNITGSVIDNDSIPISDATVFIENKIDSSVIAYTISDFDGNFALQGNTKAKKVDFFISLDGYNPYHKELDFSKNRDFKLKPIAISGDVQQLGEVTIKAAPIRIKSDTIEFNAQSFKTKPDANLEELLKELPGVKINADGKITVNGKEVNKILVNGKEFFGGDPQIALKNLPKEIIDKIQISDEKTEEQKNTGEASDSDNKEINIVIDEDKNKGLFSRLTAGAGTDDRFAVSGVGNYFKNDLQINVIGSANNINSAGFSYDDVYDMMGSVNTVTRSSNGSFSINGVSFGGNGGLTRSTNLGVGIANDFNEKIESNLNYFFSDSDTETRNKTSKTTFLPESSFAENSERAGETESTGHRFNGQFKFKIDSLTTLNFDPSVNLTTGNQFSNSNAETFNENGDLVNSVKTNNRAENSNSSIRLNLDLFKRFNNKASFSFSTSADLSDTESNSQFFSDTFLADDNSNEIQDQNIDNNNKNNVYSFSTRYRHPFAENWHLNTGYSYNYRVQESDRQVFDLESGSSVFNTELSSDYQVKSNSNKPNIGVSYRNKETNLSYSLSLGVDFVNLRNEDFLLANDFTKNFQNIFISARAGKRFKSKGSLWFNYRTSTNIPFVTQLQPIENRTNPTNIRVGNPDLDAGLNHRLYFNFNKYDWNKRQGFYSGIGFNLKQNQVVPITITDEDLIRTTTYTNENGAYNSWLYSSYSKDFEKDKRTFGFLVGLDANFNNDIGFTNGLKYNAQRVGVSPNLGISYSFNELIDLELEYSLDWNQTSYDVSNFNSQNFTNHNFAIDVTTYFPKNWTFGFRGEYQKLGNISDGFDDDSFLTVASLGYEFWKKNAAIKLKAYDIFGEIITTRRTVRADYIQDTENLTLERYFMLSFTYKFKKFAGKKERKNRW